VAQAGRWQVQRSAQQARRLAEGAPVGARAVQPVMAQQVALARLAARWQPGRRIGKDAVRQHRQVSSRGSAVSCLRARAPGMAHVSAGQMSPPEPTPRGRQARAPRAGARAQRALTAESAARGLAAAVLASHF
jgi:hypothetical protein